MKSYLSLVPISAKVRRRRNRMTLMCISLAVFLVTVVFSMVEMAVKMEKTNLIRKHGNWHFSVQNISEDAAEQIGLRSDVDAISWVDEIEEEALEGYEINGRKAAVFGVDESWMRNIWSCLREGAYPQEETEIMLSSNGKEALEVGIGDSITLNTPLGSLEYTISGFGEHDFEFTRLYDTIIVYMNRAAFTRLCEQNGREVSPSYYVSFKTDLGAGRRITVIKEEYNLTEDLIEENTALLGITGYSSNEYAKALYPIAAALFVLILTAGVFMISSSMNSNVAQRTQFFGMMRCIGMSKQQLIRFVRLEALNWCKAAVPIGILLGIVVTWGLCVWLKYGVGGELTELPVFQISLFGIFLGVAVGILTVLIAARSPARNAAKVSPVAAVSGNVEPIKNVRQTMHIGFFKIETALGIHHAILAKKNRILMTGSFALSIILFFGFSAGLNFAKALSLSTR